LTERTETDAFETAFNKEASKREQEVIELQREKEEGLNEIKDLKEENQLVKSKVANLEKAVQELESERDRLKQIAEERKERSQEKLGSLGEANGGSKVEFDAENDDNLNSASRGDRDNLNNESVLQAVLKDAQQNELMVTDFLNSLFKKVGIQINQNHLKNKEQQEELVSKLISALSENMKKNSFEPPNPSRFKPATPQKEENPEAHESKASILPVPARRHVPDIPSSDTIFYILTLLSSNAHSAKGLWKKARHYESERIITSIRKIIAEIRELNERTLRDYKANKYGNPENYPHFLKYIHNLLNECNIKQRELRHLQDELLTSFN